jgi:hypothetical protein
MPMPVQLCGDAHLSNFGYGAAEKAVASGRVVSERGL